MRHQDYSDAAVLTRTKWGRERFKEAQQLFKENRPALHWVLALGQTLRTMRLRYQDHEFNRELDRILTSFTAHVHDTEGVFAMRKQRTRRRNAS